LFSLERAFVVPFLHALIMWWQERHLRIATEQKFIWLMIMS
jgi:hypothetical protein